MPIKGICQPDYIRVDDTIRLRKYDGAYEFALSWYQDPETVWLVDGKTDPYDLERLKGMYDYLDDRGELYFIERLTDLGYIPIGDVAFWQDDMPIVIGDKAYRGQGIGRRVISALVRRGKELGYPVLRIDEIYRFNLGSRKCFESVGFQACEETERGHRFCLELTCPPGH